MTDIEDKIMAIVAQETRRDRASLSLDTELSEIESLDLVQIIFAIEDEFDVYVPQEDETFKLDNLRDVVDGVKLLLAEKQDQSAESA
ncbi:MAG: acyl carrier protein [Rhodospirillaceae bacterium]|nr:acyl carrier protein [Rhodospirillaceae bacterium]